MTIHHLSEHRQRLTARRPTIHPHTLLRELERDVVHIQHIFLEQDRVYPDQCRRSCETLSALQELTQRVLISYRLPLAFRAKIEQIDALVLDLLPRLAVLRHCHASSPRRAELHTAIRERLNPLVSIYAQLFRSGT